jgi:hypothetical protein
VLRAHRKLIQDGLAGFCCLFLAKAQLLVEFPQNQMSELF